MSLSPDDCLRTLNAIWSGTASFDEQAALDFFLLDLLQKEGSEGVGDLLRSFPDESLGTIVTSSSGADVRFTITRDEGPPLLIDTFVQDDLAFVNVAMEAPASPPVEADPRHTAFYTVWKSFLRTEPPAPDHADEGERAVFLVGLLEAELMNGGFGQYLTNTDGVHLSETVACLERIGANKTRELLLAAAKLGTQAESYVAAWDDESEAYSRLDAEFYDSGEDLAGLTADRFLEL